MTARRGTRRLLSSPVTGDDLDLLDFRIEGDDLECLFAAVVFGSRRRKEGRWVRCFACFGETHIHMSTAISKVGLVVVSRWQPEKPVPEPE